MGGHGHTVLSTWVQALALLLLSSGAGVTPYSCLNLNRHMRRRIPLSTEFG